MTASGSAEFDLLKKSELKIVGIALDGADLRAVAAATAEVLQLERDEVLVTDYLDDTITLDLLRSTLYSHQFVAKQDELLTRMRQVPGVTVERDATVESQGMLGWIAADSEDMSEAISRAQAQAADILRRVAKRVKIFSTGAEIVAGQVKDTNRTAITEALTPDGFSCDFGGSLTDDIDLIAGSMRSAAFEGYGLVLTTGGVGAESKDKTIEALLKLDPSAATPYLVRFETGHGRHVKEGVRIGVGRHEQARIVCLPGPTDEVRCALEVLRQGLRDELGSAELASAVARKLRSNLRTHMQSPIHMELDQPT
jgi:molybdenum cofactor synthesis domain-containing protein